MTEQKKEKDVQKVNLNDADDLWGSVAAEDKYEDDSDLFLDDLLNGSDYSSSTSGYQEEFQSYEDLYEDGELSQEEEYTEEYPEEYTEEYYEEEQYEEEAEEYYDDEEYYEEAPPEEEYADAVDEVSPAEEEYQEVPVEAAVEAAPSEPVEISAVIEHIGGMKQDVANVRLFEPEESSLLAVDESGDEQIIFFDQLTCLWLSSPPPRFSGKNRESCIKEQVETDDGKTHYVFAHPDQEPGSVLFSYSIDDQSEYPVTLIPLSHITKRTQDRQVAEILLEKRFISKQILRKAQKEYVQLKSMTLEKVIAKRARMPLEEVEKIIKDGMEGPFMGMQKEEILLFSGIMTEEDVLGSVDDLEKIDRLKFAQYLVDRKVVGENDVYVCLAEKHMVPFLDLKGRKISKKSFGLLPKNLIKQHEILPLGKSEDTLLVAAHYVDMDHLVAKIAKAASCRKVRFVLSPASQIRKIINLLYPEN